MQEWNAGGNKVSPRDTEIYGQHREVFWMQI